MKKLKEIPGFKNESEEFEFWKNADSTDYVNWDNAEISSFPGLKKTSMDITLSIPVNLLEQLKIRANKINVPFESLVKMYILKSFYDNSRSYGF